MISTDSPADPPVQRNARARARPSRSLASRLAASPEPKDRRGPLHPLTNSDDAQQTPRTRPHLLVVQVHPEDVMWRTASAASAREKAAGGSRGGYRQLHVTTDAHRSTWAPSPSQPPSKRVTADSATAQPSPGRGPGHRLVPGLLGIRSATRAAMGSGRTSHRPHPRRFRRVHQSGPEPSR